jgi:cytoskeletal protein CcmA (bactofilin family)
MARSIVRVHPTMASDLVTKPQGWQDVRVSLGSDAEVSGKLSFATATRIEGKLKGEIRSSDLLVIGPSAVVQATVRADRLVVLGEVHGEVQSATRVHICSGGKLYGDVETRGLVIDEGGVLEGRCKMSDGATRVASEPTSLPLQPNA